MAADAAMLAEIPLFSLLDGTERFTLAGLLELRRFERGTVLFEAGDAGDCLYIVHSGRIRIYVEDTTGERIELAVLEKGEVLGELSLLDGGPRTASAEAVDDAELLEMDRGALEEIVRRHPHAALDLLAVTGRRLRNTADMIRRRATKNVNVIAEEKYTFGQRVADRVAAFGGSWSFILFFGAVLVLWMGINAVVLSEPSRFDPYPFILLNLVLSTLAALQAPVIMMSQNRQAAKDRLQADLDYEVNLKAELEIAQLHVKIDRLYEVMQARFAQQERDRRHAAVAPEAPR